MGKVTYITLKEIMIAILPYKTAQRTSKIKLRMQSGPPSYPPKVSSEKGSSSEKLWERPPSGRLRRAPSWRFTWPSFM
jgi:hypothetical protein